MAEQDENKRSPRPPLAALRDFLLGPPGDSTPARTPGPVAASAAGPPQEAPLRIGPYLVLRKLGQGGMGVVYAARDERLERTLAIKTILGLADDETARKRFWREAKAAASVNHPNICQLYEVGEEKGGLFIAMELLDGQPLSERLRGGALLVDEAVPAALAILSALGALHARGIVHRDLKPSNVFLTPHGVKLLDFGLARPADSTVTSSATSLTDLTRPGALGHKFYAHFEAEVGRAPEAMTRLLRLAATNRNDPELFAGLVHACRYCGLFDASIAAHREARRLDPHVGTSVPYTLIFTGDYESLLHEGIELFDSELSAKALWHLGRRTEAIETARRTEARNLPRLFQKVATSIRLCLEGPREEAVRVTLECLAEHQDPEAVFLLATSLALLGEHARALEELGRAVRGGFLAAQALARDPWLDPLRATPALRAILAEAEAGRGRALVAFREAGGEALLGVKPVSTLSAS